MRALTLSGFLNSSPRCNPKVYSNPMLIMEPCLANLGTIEEEQKEKMRVGKAWRKKHNWEDKRSKQLQWEILENPVPYN